MRVDIEEILGMEARRNQINDTPLDQLEFYKDDKKIEVPASVVKGWRFVGLTNTYFALEIADGEMPDLLHGD